MLTDNRKRLINESLILKEFLFKKKDKKDSDKKDSNRKIVSKQELVSERNRFRSKFYQTLSKYPILKKKFRRHEEVYDDSFNPYEYNISYGDILENDEGELKAKTKKAISLFEDELDKIPLKYHHFNSEDQHDHHFFQLYSNDEKYYSE
jgi:hypothetical protein